MNTVFLPPDLSTQPSGSFMNSVSGVIPSPLIAAAAAANADELGEARKAAAAVEPPAALGGWDAYEVWRRFIKDARERRQQQE